MIARGEWGEDSGESGYRNHYKGHMDKTKGECGGREGGGFGWGWVEGWGENADNSNLIAIIFLKRNLQILVVLLDMCNPKMHL